MKNLILDFSRNQEPGNPFFRPAGQIVSYTLHSDIGGAHEVRIDWSKELREDLEHAGNSVVDSGIVQRLSDRLRSMLPARFWAIEEKAIAAAISAEEPVRITLRSAAEELYTLPWDLLTEESGQHLFKRPTVLLRYALPGTRTVAEQPTPRLEGGRVLFAWSEAAGDIPLEQRDAIAAACKLANVPFTELKDVTVAKLKSALASDPPVAVLHILCHGGQRFAEDQTLGLVFNAGSEDANEDKGTEQNAKHLVDARQLESVLSPHAGHLRLVVLSACQSADIHEIGNHLGSPALAIHKAGIQALIASRFVLSQDASKLYFASLYRELFAPPASIEEAFLKARQSVAGMKSKLAWASLQLYARPEDGEDARPVIFRPYRGLAPFEAAHARFLFGRDAEVANLLADMAALEQAGKPRFQVVLGASGTGKSSVILGGVIPKLVRTEDEQAPKDPSIDALQQSLKYLDQFIKRRGADASLAQIRETFERTLTGLRGTVGASWQVEILRPSATPLAALEAALKRREDKRRLLLVIDQFEEIFTQTAEPAVRSQFVRALWQSAQGENPVHCLVSLREDFIERCAELALSDDGTLRFDGLVRDESHRLVVAQLGKSELRKVIEQPARRVGLELEAGLAERLLAEVEGEPGALPLLEYTLDLLWQRREGRRLTMRAYLELGGVSGAFERKADALLDGLAPVEQAVARRLLVRLVGLGQHAAADTRLCVQVAHLRAREPESAAIFEKVVERLVQGRLLVASGDREKAQATLEFAHEALIRKWERLRKWLGEDRARLVEVTEMEALVARTSGLLEGSHIGYARAVLDKYPGEVSEAVRKIIEESERVASEKLAQERRTAEARWQKLLASYVEQGRQYLLDGDAPRALLWLERAYKEGCKSLSLRYLLAEAMRPSDALRLSLVGHEMGVTSASFSADGSRIVTSSKDATARIWDAATGACLLTLSGHEAGVRSASFSPDGRAVLTSSADGRIAVWDAKTGEARGNWSTCAGGSSFAQFSADGKSVLVDCEASLVVLELATGKTSFTAGGYAGQLRAAELSCDGSRLITAGAARGLDRDDVELSLWNVKAGKKIPLAHSGAAFGACFSPDGKRAAVTSDYGASILDAATGQELRRLSLERECFGVCFSPDGSRVLTNCHDNTVKIWDVASGQLMATLSGHTGLVLRARCSRDGSRVLTLGKDDTVRIWNASRGELLLTLLGYGFLLFDANFSPDGSRVVTATEDPVLKVWDARQGKLKTELGAYQSQVRCVSFDASGSRLFYGSLVDGQDQRSGQVPPEAPMALVWDARTGQKLAELGKGHGVWAAAFSQDASRAVTASLAALELWDAANGKLIAPLSGHTALVSQTSFSSDSRLLITASEDGTAKVWAAGDGKLVRTLDAHEAAVSCAGFSPDARLAATGVDAYEAALRIFELGTGKCRQKSAHGGRIKWVQFSPDGQSLASAGSDGCVRIWELATDLLSAPMFHLDEVYQVSFSPDGRRLLTASKDQSAKLWDAKTRKLQLSLDGHTGAVLCASFSPDGRFVATASSDSTVRIWDAETGKALSVLPHRGMVGCLTFSPDGHRLMTGGWDKTVRIWDIRLESRDKAQLSALISQHIPLVFQGEEDLIVPKL